MAPASLSTSGSSRLSQFGLYRSIDARTEEFMKLSRRRQLRQGCACAAVSTIVTVTVVIVLILVYLQSMNTSESTVVRNRRPQKWEKINNAKDEDAMNIISKHGEDKLKRARVNFHMKDLLIKNTEAPPALTDIEQFSKIKKTFPSIRHMMKGANRTFPIEYKLPRIYYSKSLKNRLDIINTIRRFKPLLAEETKIFQEGNTDNSFNHNIVKNIETDHNLHIETKKNLHTGKQIYQNMNKIKMYKNVKTQLVESNIKKNQNSKKNILILEKIEESTKKGQRHVNGTLNLQTNSSSSLNTVIENQITKYAKETDLCNNKDLLRQFLDKLISICIKKGKTKSKCKMACCNTNKTSSEKPIIKTNVTVNAQSTYTSHPITITNIPTIPTTTSTTKHPFVKYGTGDINYDNDYVSTKTTTMAPDENQHTTATRKLATFIKSHEDTLAETQSLEDFANIQNNMNIFKTTKKNSHINNTLKYPTKPISDIISSQTNQVGQTFQGNQIRDLLNDQEVTTTTELTITTNSNNLAFFAPILQFDENTDVPDKKMGVTKEYSMKESASSSFNDYFSPKKDRVHQEHLYVKAIKSSTVPLENEKTYTNRNGYKYSRLPGQSFNFHNNKMKEPENIKSAHKVNHKTNKHYLFQPYQTIQTNYTNFDSTVLKNDNNDNDDENQKYKATTNILNLNHSNSNTKTLPLTSNNIYDFIHEKPKVTINTIKPNKQIQTLYNQRIIAENIIFPQNNTDYIRPKTVGTYVSPIKSMERLVIDETVTKESIIYTTENLPVTHTGVIMDRSADEWINHKANEIKSTAMFTTEAVGINLSRQTPSVLPQDMKTIAIQKSKDMGGLPINDVLDKEVFDEVRDQNNTKEMQPHLKNLAKLGLNVARRVKDKKVFENILSDNVTMNKTDVLSKKLHISCFVHNPHKKKVQSVSAINFNDIGVQVKDNLLFSSHGNIGMNSDNISEESFDLLDTTRIDDYIQNESKSKISSSNINEAAYISMTQPIERNESNILTEIEHVMSSVKQTSIEDERESTEVLATTTQLTTNFESEEGSKEIGITSESYAQKPSVSRNLPWYRIDLLDAQRNIGETNKRILTQLNQLLQSPRPYSEEHEDTTQSEVLPETSTYTQIRNKVFQNCKVSERKMRTVDSFENLSESPKKIEGDNIKKILQPQKSYSQNFESTSEIKPLLGTTIQRHQQQQAVRVCGDKCKVSEENAKIFDSSETLEDLDVDALIKRRHTEWTKKKQVELNQIIKPGQSYRWRAGLPSYLEIARNDFSNSNSIQY